MICAYQQAADALKTGIRTKIHLLSNALGLPVAVTLSGGSDSDGKDCTPVVDEFGPAPRVLKADKVYYADFMLAELEARSVAAVITVKRKSRGQPIINEHIYNLRNLVERCFSSLKNSQRRATRYEEAADCFPGFVLVAPIRLWIGHLVHSA